MERSTPTVAQLRRLIHAYRAVLVPIVLGIGYLGWIIWEVRGGDEMPDGRLHTTILAIIGVSIVLLRPVRDKTMLLRIAGELRALNRRIDAQAVVFADQVEAVGRQVDALGEDFIGPLAADATRSKFVVALVQGRLDQLNASLQELKTELSDAVTGAYRKGLVAGAQGASEVEEERTLSVINGQNGSRLTRQK